MGVKFSAACTLDCTEYPEGVPANLCSFDGDGSDGLLPHPRTSLAGCPCHDITFRLVEGDFKVRNLPPHRISLAFRGIWRMQPVDNGSPAKADAGSSSAVNCGSPSNDINGSEKGQGGPAQSQWASSPHTNTLLCYSLYVQPQTWLPVGLIQSRIEKEVFKNLDAVRVHAERVSMQGLL
ncbi:polyketide_cyc domain-containing protein [Haematococcus lacustris]|uniref:Polyketide_cyc domain-containing protein n=1 Tax=Haematococcus lacustris TaxID=44745 RepID=A0A699YKG3_HAELA|nr:polyketide_cyc domain-containing protein [Haematococcus lacustris]